MSERGFDPTLQRYVEVVPKHFLAHRQYDALCAETATLRTEVERLLKGNKSHAKTIRAKLKEFKRVISEAWYERQLPNQWYGSGSSSARRAHGNYKGKSHIVWGEAATMAADECFAAIRALAAQKAGDEE